MASLERIPRWSAVLVFLALLLGARPASAAGSVKLASSRIEESDGAWRLKFTIDYGSVPHRPHVPMIFSFKPTMLYERSITDQSPDNPIERKVPLSNQTPINLSMDVGFADPASGKIYKGTNFSMKLTRTRDFEAGEYALSVKIEDGGPIGGTQTVYLLGKNKPIDRRSITFHASAPPPPKKEEGGAGKKSEGDDGPRSKAAEDQGPDLSDIPDTAPPEGTDEAPGPPAVEPKQGGCGCRLGGPVPSRLAWGAVGLFAALLARRRRRRSR
jgi:MYXO-CTERM domain-containing protein